MAMPPALAAALAAKSGGKKKPGFGKSTPGDDDSAGPDALDLKQAAAKKLAAPKPGAKKSLPPWLMKK